MKTASLNKNAFILIAGALLLLAVGIKWSLSVPQHMDILFGDEAEYIRNGLDLFTIIRNDWGPAYNIWYKLLSFFFSDTIHLYYANYIIGAVALPILLFFVLSAFRINKLLAVYMSFCFLVSGVNMNTWPRISHFVLILVLATLLFISRLKSNAKKFLALTIVTYICSYARPDLFFSFVLLLLISLFFLYREKNNFRLFVPYLLIFLVSILFFQLVFGFPSPTYKGGLNRLYSAFCQHYSMNYKFRTNAQFDAVTEWIEFCKVKFPDCKTIGDVLTRHPGDFIENFFFNLKNYSGILFKTILSFILPTSILPGKKASIAALAIFIIAVLGIMMNSRKRKLFLVVLKENWILFTFLVIFGLPSMGMCAIIFPRPHYILLHSLLLVFLLAIIFNSFLRSLELRWTYFLPLAFILLWLAPRAGRYRYMQFGKDMDNLCDQKLVRFLEKDNHTKYTVLTNYLNITYILPKNYSEFSTEFELKRGMHFKDVLEEMKINMILVSGNLLQNPILTKDTTWNSLIKNPGSYQFKKINYSNICESYLLIKE